MKKKHKSYSAVNFGKNFPDFVSNSPSINFGEKILRDQFSILGKRVLFPRIFFPEINSTKIVQFFLLKFYKISCIGLEIKIKLIEITKDVYKTPLAANTETTRCKYVESGYPNLYLEKKELFSRI